MQLTGPYAFGPPPDRASAIGVLQAAAAAGVDHIDTAHYNGPDVVAARSRATARAGWNQHFTAVRGRSVLRCSGRVNHHDLVRPAHLPGGKPGSDPPPGREFQQRIDNGDLFWERCRTNANRRGDPP
jgi:hypothetical protein